MLLCLSLCLLKRHSKVTSFWQSATCYEHVPLQCGRTGDHVSSGLGLVHSRCRAFVERKASKGIMIHMKTHFLVGRHQSPVPGGKSRTVRLTMTSTGWRENNIVICTSLCCVELDMDDHRISLRASKSSAPTRFRLFCCVVQFVSSRKGSGAAARGMRRFVLVPPLATSWKAAHPQGQRVATALIPRKGTEMSSSWTISQAYLNRPHAKHNQFTPETYPLRVIFIGMMNEIPISSQGPKGGNPARSGKKCSLLRKVQARVLHVFWSRFRRDLEG